MRVLVEEAARHAAENPDGTWGELQYTPDGRRSYYWITRRVRKGWSVCNWQRWVPVTHHSVRPKGSFSRNR